MKFYKAIKYLTVAALASCSLATLAASTQSSSTKPTSPQLGVQLWSVKDDVAADFELAGGRSVGIVHGGSPVRRRPPVMGARDDGASTRDR